MRKGTISITFYGAPCKRWWCTNTGGVYACVESLNAPANVVNGPYLIHDDCNAACFASDSPYWCDRRNCVKSVESPAWCSEGPYATYQDCLDACDQADGYRGESFWLFGFGATYGDFKCFQSGEYFEPETSTWGADYISEKYRVQVTLSVVDFTSISVTADIFTNSPRSVWIPYTTIAYTLTEKSCTSTNPAPNRIRYFESPYIPVTVSEAGGLGDPVAGADMRVTLYGEAIGCGWPHSFENDMGPICGMFDGVGWYTCFRAHIESPKLGAELAQPGVLVEMGLKKFPSGSGTAIIFAECDRIYKDGLWKTLWNYGGYGDAFKSRYQYIGFAGEDSDDTQQIQIGISGGYNLCVKKIGNRGMQIGVQNPSTQVWEITSLTTVQPDSPIDTSHPWIHYANLPVMNISIYLYSMRFPSPEILPGACCTILFPESPNCDPSSSYSSVPPKGGDDASPRTINARQFHDQFRTYTTSPALTAQTEARNRILQRIKLPCVNLGEFIEHRKLSCGCGTFSVFKCEKYGECVKIAPSVYKDLKHCDNCDDYATT